MNRVLVISHERVGPRMAGPAIRCWELSRVLATELQVTLAVPGGTTLEPDGFELLPFSFDGADPWSVLEHAARSRADVVVASAHLLNELPFLRDLPVPLVADAYIPLPVESLAWHVLSERSRQMAAYEYSWHAAHLIARHADLISVAGEPQRDFWLGVLAAAGRLHPDAYAADANLRNLVQIVPVGCPSTAPQPGPALKGVWPGIGRHDRAILWGGGVWNWFDPLTLLRAMPQVLSRHPEARLVFPGANHPDAGRVPEMGTARQARALSEELGLTGRSVFWGDWVPYAGRGAYLLDASLGVSLHRAGLEPHFSFRSRLLDCIWTGLPMVLTEGDVLGRECAEHGLAVIVHPGDVDGVARAIQGLLDEPEPRQAREAAFSELRRKYSWEQVAAPLVRFCRSPRVDPAKQEAALAESEWTGKEAEMALAEATWKSEQAGLQAEIGRLEGLVRGYESGRLMRLLSALHRLRRRWTG
jgi:glycosyltransferase involved in cell wall biosynthesis